MLTFCDVGPRKYYKNAYFNATFKIFLTPGNSDEPDDASLDLTVRGGAESPREAMLKCSPFTWSSALRLPVSGM